MDNDQDDVIVGRLVASGSYRVLRRLPSPIVRGDLDLNPERRLVLVLAAAAQSRNGRRATSAAAILATYDHLGIRDVVATLSPSGPTLIDDGDGDGDADGSDLSMVGRLDVSTLQAFSNRIHLLVQHGTTITAKGRAEIAPILEAVPSIDARSSVPWEAFGVEGTGIGAILHHLGYFLPEDRPIESARALLTVLSAEQWSGHARTPFSHLLEAVSATRVTILISGDTYASRGLLKARGYRWSDGTGSLPKAWFLRASRADAAIEIAWANSRLHPHGATVRVRETTDF